MVNQILRRVQAVGNQNPAASINNLLHDIQHVSVRMWETPNGAAPIAPA
jgi:hypothetical protein